MSVDLNYGIGVEGKNLVLKTLGRVYVKVKDRKYELLFRPEDIRDTIERYSNSTEEDTDSTITPATVIFIESQDSLSTLQYPGDNVFIISKDGTLFFTNGGKYTQLEIKFTGDTLDVDTLYVNKSLTINGTSSFLNIPNNSLVTNLNADYLDGYQASQFAIKDNSETITKNWDFKQSVSIDNTISFNSGIGESLLTDPTKNKIIIDFSTGMIQCDTISAQNVDLPEVQSSFDLVSGLGSEVWVGPEISILEENITSTIVRNNYNIVSLAYDVGDLPNYSSEEDDAEEWDLVTFWYDKIFFDSYDDDEGTYILKDFNNITIWNETNANFDNTEYDLSDFQNIINALELPDTSEFTGDYYQVKISTSVGVINVVPNMIFKDNFGNVGYIVTRESEYLYVQMKDSNTLLYGSKITIIGSLNNKAGICLFANNPSISILNNCLDNNSYSVYIGELSKVDNTKSGIGVILNGSGSINNDSITWSDRDYLQISNAAINGCDLLSCNANFNNNIIINSDGSGSIGLLKISNTGNVSVSDIPNGDVIRFGPNIVSLNLPIGPAGGDLQGTYPNPTINVSFKNSITSLQSWVEILERRITSLEERVTALEPNTE